MFLVDSLVNFVTGLGTNKDKSAHTQHVFMPMDRAELEAAYRSDWIARKVVKLPAQDATREWREWQADRDQITKIENLEKNLGLKRKLERALILSRLAGGSVMIIGTATNTPQDPLNSSEFRNDGLRYVHVLSRYQVNYGPMITDVLSPWYGEPSYWTRATTDTGVGQSSATQIHPSRVVKFLGNERPDVDANQTDPWSDSVLQPVMDACRAAGIVIGSGASMASEATVDVYRIPAFTDQVTNKEYRDQLTTRFTYANLAKSVNNALILDKEEEWERIQTQFNGLPDLLKVYLLVAAGAADIPATRFLSQSPAGLNATGDSDTRNYYDHIGSEQRNTIQPNMARLDSALVQAALGGEYPDIFYNWKPLWQMDEDQKSQIALRKAQAFQIDVNCGLVDPLALKEGRENQLIEDGTYPGFEQALEDAEALATYTPEDFALAFGPQPPPPPAPLVIGQGQRVIPPPTATRDSLPEPRKRSRFMHTLTLADSLGIRFTDFNEHHAPPGPGGGQFTSGSSGGVSHFSEIKPENSRSGQALIVSTKDTMKGIKEAEPLINKLAERQSWDEESIRIVTGDTNNPHYEFITAVQRGERRSSPEIDQAVKKIDGMFSQASAGLPEPLTVFRGVRFPMKMPDYKVGDEFTDPAYFMTTLSPGYAMAATASRITAPMDKGQSIVADRLVGGKVVWHPDRAVFQLELPAGQKALVPPTRTAASTPESLRKGRRVTNREAIVLLPHNSRFKVTAIDRPTDASLGAAIVHLKVIPNDAPA